MYKELNVDDTEPISLDILPSEHEWERRGVWDDGSCFFHSLACIINYNGYHAMSKKQKITSGHALRKAVRECLTAATWQAVLKEHDLDKIGPSFEVVANDLDNNKTWANYWSILFTFHMLELNVVFYDLSKRGMPYCGVTHVKPSKSLSCGQLPRFGWKLCGVLWLKHCHFEPLCCKGKFLFDPKASPGSDMIKSYDMHGQCPIPTKPVLQVIAKQNLAGGAGDASGDASRGAFRRIWSRRHAEE